MHHSLRKETSSGTNRFGGVYTAAAIVLAVIGCIASAVVDSFNGQKE